MRLKKSLTNRGARPLAVAVPHQTRDVAQVAGDHVSFGQVPSWRDSFLDSGPDPGTFRKYIRLEVSISPDFGGCSEAPRGNQGWL